MRELLLISAGAVMSCSIFALGAFIGSKLTFTPKKVETPLRSENNVKLEDVKNVSVSDEEARYIERHAEYDLRIQQIKEELKDVEVNANPPMFFDFDLSEVVEQGMPTTIITEERESEYERKAKLGL